MELLVGIGVELGGATIGLAVEVCGAGVELIVGIAEELVGGGVELLVGTGEEPGADVELGGVGVE